jgi:hypothetical protein
MMVNRNLKVLSVTLLFGSSLFAVDAQADDSRWTLADVKMGDTSFTQYDRPLRELLSKEVGMVRAGSSLADVNFWALDRRGMKLPKNFRWDPVFEREALKLVDWRTVKTGEKGDFIAHAMRYSSSNSSGILGSGRNTEVTRLPVVDPKTGQVIAMQQLDLKGVGTTGLEPKAWGDPKHMSGTEKLWHAYADGFFADFLEVNGMRTNNSVLLGYRGEGNGTNGRLGEMDRLATVAQAAKGGKDMIREWVDRFADRRALELGQKQRMNVPTLFKHVGNQKAHELALAFFMRVGHGAPTSDNTFINEWGDHGGNSTSDKLHWNHIPRDGSQHTHDERGMGQQIDTFMWRFLAGRTHVDMFKNKGFLNILQGSAMTAAERSEMAQMDIGKVIGKSINDAMVHHTLLSVGFSEADAKYLMHHHRKEASAIHDKMIGLAKQTGHGEHRVYGREKDADAFDIVRQPAQHDIYMALGSASHGKGPLAQPVEVLIGKLKDRYKLAGMEVTALKEMMQVNALHRNHFANQMVRRSLNVTSQRIANKIDQAHRKMKSSDKAEQANGEALLRAARAESAAFRRGYNFLGEGAAYRVAQNVASGRVKSQANMAILSEHKENGVAIRQLSNGKKDVIQVELADNPLNSKMGKYSMRYKLANGQWSEISGRNVDKSTVVFEVDVTDKNAADLKAFKANFKANGHVAENFGFGWGSEMPVVFADQNVRASLGLLAKRNGLKRAQTEKEQRVTSAMERAYPQVKAAPSSSEHLIKSIQSARHYRARPVSGRR